ncbi:hypothetical protein LTR70_006496 [Exophiala xenobiotica]|uniref:Uncharacterized protein n=1 Tax=Lithohypha guttulata TaxID=1690604 RepID=A0ABR0JY02_9EURO|nr:hypothetical protein LTR24_009086 [Lithohypha guttulata]KAK5315944.1 hypothetical protein LTR70_006496 [Exophiala xenobiotica]
MSTSRSILKLLPLRRPTPRSHNLIHTPLPLRSPHQTRPTSNTAAQDTHERAATNRDVANKKSAQQNLAGIDRQSDEYALSGTDDAVAQQHTVAFDPSQPTDPAHAKDMAGKGDPQHNPLEVSAANPEVSSAANEGGYSRKEKETVTYAGHGQGKAKQGVVPENKAYAAQDKRKSDRPQDVKVGTMAPGSR